MGVVSLSLPADGSTGTVSQYNTPLTTLQTEFNGNIDNNNIKAGAGIDGAKLADAGVTAAKLATNAITLGYGQITTDFATASSSFVDTGITTGSITIPAGGRRVEFVIQATAIKNSATGVWVVALVEDSTVIQQWYRNQDTATATNMPLHVSFSKVPTAGSHTYKVQLATNAGTATISANTTSSTPIVAGAASILVKAI